MQIRPVQTNFDTMVADEGGRHATPVPLSDADAAAANEASWGANGFGFDDALDVVNPLQHLPVVGTVYREMTGDTMSPAARVLGGVLFGGPIGFVLAIASAIFEEATGKSVGTALAELVTGAEQPVQLADANADDGAPKGTTGGLSAGAEQPAAPAAVLAEAVAAPAELPAVAPAVAGAPQLSPQAFDALMRSFSSGPAAPAAAAGGIAPTGAHLAPPAPKAAPRPSAQATQDSTGLAVLPRIAPAGPAVTAPTPLLRAPKTAEAEPALDDRRQAALDLHSQLQAYAEQKGVRVKPAATR